MKMRILVVVFVNQAPKPLGLRKPNEGTVRVIDFLVVKLFQCQICSKFSNLPAHVSDFQRIDLLLGMEI